MPRVTLEDISLKNYDLTARVSHLRDIYFKAFPEIFVERPRLITCFTLDRGFFNQDSISVLDKARTYRYVLENRFPIVCHNRAYDKKMSPFEFQPSPAFWRLHDK